MKKHHTIPVGPLLENCHVVWEESSRQALLFDPGDQPEEILAFLKKKGLTPLGILLTHAHFDHIGAIPALARELSLPVWCPQADLPLYHSPENCMAPWHPAVAGLPEPADAPAPEFGYQALATPGHTPGGTSYYFPEEGFVLTGDTLFAGSVGRTDFPGGSERALQHSVTQVLFALPGKTLVLPGHGPKTTIATEKLDPFFA